MSAQPPRIDVLCTHGRTVRGEHQAILARMCAELEGEGLCRSADGTGPLVLLSCGDGERGAGRARSQARHAGASVEIVHVRIGTPEACAQAQRIARGALRFAALAGESRAPRRGFLGAFARESPLRVVEDRCSGSPPCGKCASGCPANAIQLGTAGRPIVRPAACNLCGRCIETCPTGAMGWAHAPWSAVLARLEALLSPRPGEGRAEPIALLLGERASPLAPDEPRETEQPAAPGVVPLELPRGTLGPAMVLRALELGASRVCAVVARESAETASGLEAAAAVARAFGAPTAVRVARSTDEAMKALAEPLTERVDVPAARAMDGCCRPDAFAIAEALWRRASASAPVTFRATGAFGGAVTAHAARCTLCDECTRACPSGAIALRSEAGTVSLVFDSGRCRGGCGLCARACPYKALQVCDEVRLPAQQAVLVAARSSTCSSCGAGWTGAQAVPALERRYDVYGRNQALRSFLTECPSCRRRKLAASLRTVNASGSCIAPQGPDSRRSSHAGSALRRMQAEF